VFLIVLALAAKVSANSNDSLVLDNDLASNDSMTWPMLPGESLNELAAKFYPKNKVMQRHFTAKTLRLNMELLPNLDANTDFAVPTAVIIPSLKSLSSSAHAIKSSHKKMANHNLRMTYNIKAAVENLPQNLLQEYEALVSKNSFLKVELAKLNEKLAFLQNKLNDLKLILDKTLTLPQKKVFKNLGAQELQDSKPVKPEPAKKVVRKQTIESNQFSTFFDSINKDLLLAVLAFALVAGLGSYLFKKNRQKSNRKVLIEANREDSKFGFADAWEATELQHADLKENLPLNTDTQVDDLKEGSILDEAKLFVSKNQPNEAIEHIKWAIRAQPKANINIWLYLLEIFRKQNLKTEFETYAIAMHQTFNVMTPAWEEKSVAIVVAQSLEEFPHIVETLTANWPEESAKAYLRGLISDNREGERTGFGASVLEDILLLIALLDVRSDLI